VRLSRQAFWPRAAGEPGLADAARPGDQQVAAVFDPSAGGQLLEQRLVELAGSPKVDVLDGGADMAQGRGPEPGPEPPGVAVGDLAVDQQGQPVSVGKLGCAVLRLEFGKGFRHAVELERSQLVECRVGEHGSLLSMEIA